MLKIDFHLRLGLWQVVKYGEQYFLEQGPKRWGLDPSTAVFVGSQCIGPIAHLPHPLKVRVRHGHLFPLTLDVVPSLYGWLEVMTSRAISVKRREGPIETFPLHRDQVLTGIDRPHPIAGDYIALYLTNDLEREIIGIRKVRSLSSTRHIILNRYSFRYSLDS
ncbi:hypothetical protein [Sulfobacillus thermosulfidooxidans]|uniref:hypothetical protein n=1 Tax=Sulfobacillus thermosulfidooxidans TaxID=28034 RepID=UPI00040D81BC|nr:hypothetical protein [Sulfobacillus thermosulfidooxidans]